MKNVVIIGGGVIGLCSAYYAAQRGHRVTILDRNTETKEGCSYGNAGMIVPSHFVPLAAPGAVALDLLAERGLAVKWRPTADYLPGVTPALMS